MFFRLQSGSNGPIDNQAEQCLECFVAAIETIAKILCFVLIAVTTSPPFAAAELVFTCGYQKPLFQIYLFASETRRRAFKYSVGIITPRFCILWTSIQAWSYWPFA